MDTLSAFMRGQMNRDKEMMIFDWHKAATIIRERGGRDASAGLTSDWEWTGGEILRDGIPISEDQAFGLYLGSTWAPPQLNIDGRIIECWRYESEVPDWDAHTVWPQSARDILAPPVDYREITNQISRGQG